MKTAFLCALGLLLFVGSIIALHALMDEGWFYILFVPYVLLFGAACERLHFSRRSTWRKP